MADTSTSLGAESEAAGSNHPSTRLFMALSFIPAFPLCIAHGVLADQSVPAVGLVPLAASVAGSIFLLRQPADNTGSGAEPFSHPILVFVYDVVLAAALMVVLVFTWIAKGGTPGLSMLAAYATVPLLYNFLAHLFLALEALYVGLAIGGLIHWLVWLALPPECPHCNERLRPDLPELPWLTRVRRRSSEYAALFVSDENRYYDEEDVHPQSGEAVHSPQPEAIEVRRKDKKTKSSSSTTPPDGSQSPWNP